jgi:hypothetical protein
VLSLFEQLDKDGLGSKQKSIVDRCTAAVYEQKFGDLLSSFIRPFVSKFSATSLMTLLASRSRVLLYFISIRISTSKRLTPKIKK